jgi:hypothetical protein
MLEFLNKYAKNKMYSQNGEEGILIECLKRFSDLNHVCFEFGAHNGKYCSNTRLLIQEAGYSGLMIESDAHLYVELKKGIGYDRIVPIHGDVTKENINNYLSILPKNIDVLSIDTDGDNDYDCFHAIQLHQLPKIIIVEINSSLIPEVSNRKDCYTEMVGLGIYKNYFLLCHTGNLIFINDYYRNLFPEAEGNAINNSNKYFNTKWVKE